MNGRVAFAALRGDGAPRAGGAAVAGLAIFLAGGALSSASANNYPVANGDVAGLAAAIDAANANPGPDTISLAAGGTYTLSAVNYTTNWTGPNGLPAIASEITIEGAGAVIERSATPGTPNFRILFIKKAGNLILRNAVIRNGRAEQGVPGYAGGGGGIRNDGGKVRIESSTITGNSGSDQLVGTGGNPGGGIYNSDGGILAILNSTISYNTGYGGRTGGGIHNENGNQEQSLTAIMSSTVFENRADGPQGFKGRGDAISHFAGGPGGGGIAVKNSIIASPKNGLGQDCYGFVPLSVGYNIASDASCALSKPGDLNNTDPMLGALAMNGGLTPTHLTLAGSPAINAMPAADCVDENSAPVAVDQRGAPRPSGPACDIGSVEAPSTTSICCPPFTAANLESAFTTQFYAGADPNLAGKYRLVMQPKPAFKLTDFSKQMQAYINYAHALDPSITSVTIEIAIIDICATGPTPPAYFNLGGCGATLIGGTGKLTWAFGGPNAPPVYAPANFFKFAKEALSKDVWYAVTAGIYFNGDVNNDPPATCENQVHFWHREKS